MRYEDYEIEYDDAGDMFGFFGNGFHVCEFDGASDISWYFGAPKEPVDADRVRKQMDGTKGHQLVKGQLMAAQAQE